MKAVKENKVYRIERESEKQRYLKAGYDIYSDEGVLMEHSPMKKIEYGKYAELEKNVEELRKENEDLRKENKSLKKSLSEATKDKKENPSKAGE